VTADKPSFAAFSLSLSVVCVCFLLVVHLSVCSSAPHHTHTHTHTHTQQAYPSDATAASLRARTASLHGANHKDLAAMLSLDAVVGHGARLPLDSEPVRAAVQAVLPTPAHRVAYGVVLGHIRRHPADAFLLVQGLTPHDQVRADLCPPTCLPSRRAAGFVCWLHGCGCGCVVGWLWLRGWMVVVAWMQLWLP